MLRTGKESDQSSTSGLSSLSSKVGQKSIPDLFEIIDRQYDRSAKSENRKSAMASGSLYLSPNQQGLLMTALNSNKPTGAKASPNTPNRTYPPPAQNARASVSRSNSTPQNSGQVTNNTMYTSPVQQNPPSGGFGTAELDDSPFLDYEFDPETDGNFDFDFSNGDQMIGALPGDSNEDLAEEGDLHDKRKNTSEDEEGGGKRREGDDKSAKKPGRKPLTSEPTTVSKTL